MSAFDEVVAALDPPMVAVTVCGAGGEVGGCLVGFHCQTSIDPPRYAVWLSRRNRTFRLAEGATHLGVHRLTAEQHPLAELLGGTTGDDVDDKLAGVAWSPGPGGVPLLRAVADRLVGRIVGRVELDGDHVGFELEPVEAAAPGGGPSLRLSQAADIDPGHDA